jgi:hypothetical protein
VRYFRVGAVGQRQGRRAAVPAPNTFSQEWELYRRRDQAGRRPHAQDCNCRRGAGGGGDKLRAEFKAELEREVLQLGNEFLQNRLDAARSVNRLRSVPPPALIA